MIQVLAGNTASRPSPGAMVDGFYHDTQAAILYRSYGTAWDDVDARELVQAIRDDPDLGPAGYPKKVSGLLSGLPAAGTLAFYEYYASDTDDRYISTGVSWIEWTEAGGGGGGGFTVCSLAEVEAGTENTKGVTSLRGAQQIRKRALENRYDITELTGGASTALDSLVTADGTYKPGALVFILPAEVPKFAILQNRNDAENEGAGLIRADDFVPTTNERVWVIFG